MKISRQSARYNRVSDLRSVRTLRHADPHDSGSAPGVSAICAASGRCATAQFTTALRSCLVSAICAASGRCAHHVGTTSSTAYEVSAICAASGRCAEWRDGRLPPWREVSAICAASGRCARVFNAARARAQMCQRSAQRPDAAPRSHPNTFSAIALNRPLRAACINCRNQHIPVILAAPQVIDSTAGNHVASAPGVSSAAGLLARLIKDQV